MTTRTAWARNPHAKAHALGHDGYTLCGARLSAQAENVTAADLPRLCPTCAHIVRVRTGR